MGDFGETAPPALNPSQPTASASPKEITVLVTGFGPFKSFAQNPSYLIASSLPQLLLPVLNPSDPASKTPLSPQTPIRLIVHPSPIRVSYATVHNLLPALLAAHPEADFVLHIGMAGGRSYYTLETLAHRDGYVIRDVDGGDGFGAEAAWKALAAPDTLTFSANIDAEDVQRRWKAAMSLGRTAFSQAPDVRLSDDAGHFLCDFIFYTSLVERWKQGRDRKVLFLHTPGAADAASVERGVRVATGLIRSVVDSWEERERRKAGEVKAVEEVLGKKVGVEYVA